MGHIDHGKSTLLDYIRKTNVVAKEAGGITQHISAYEVSRNDARGVEKRITFLDTPGHAAFRGMRARGARVADIAILVVSAEDGVKPQTLEAYESIKNAGIPFIVAINKIDKPNAHIERTKQTLAEAGIYLEGYGGDIPWAPISAKTGQGVGELLDILLLVAELSELRGDPEKTAEGVIIESHMDTKKGPTATVVIVDGTMRKGMFAIAEHAIAPLRSIENFLGKSVTEATFSMPVRISGWSEVPAVGAIVKTFEKKRDAEEAARKIHVQREADTTTEENSLAAEDVVMIPVILKADVAGSLEAVEFEMGKLRHEHVRIKIIHKGIGAISEGDIKIALGAKEPLVIGFHTKTDALAQDLAARSGITIRHFDIIYKLTEWLDAVMKERAPVIEVAERLGELKVLRCFSQQKERQIIGGRVEKGCMTAGTKFKIVRRGEEVGEGRVIELQCQKMKTTEVGEGNECGLQVESRITIAERDVLIPYRMVTKQ